MTVLGDKAVSFAIWDSRPVWPAHEEGSSNSDCPLGCPTKLTVTRKISVSSLMIGSNLYVSPFGAFVESAHWPQQYVAHEVIDSALRITNNLSRLIIEKKTPHALATSWFYSNSVG